MFDGAQDTMLASNTTLQSSEFSTTQEMIDLYNHDTSDSDAESAIFTYGKFTTATAASVGLGSMAFEAGHAPDGANEATFAGTVERLEAEAVLVAVLQVNVENCHPVDENNREVDIEQRKEQAVDRIDG